jgi:hypothetical protein
MVGVSCCSSGASSEMGVRRCAKVSIGESNPRGGERGGRRGLFSQARYGAEGRILLDDVACFAWVWLGRGKRTEAGAAHIECRQKIAELYRRLAKERRRQLTDASSGDEQDVTPSPQ